MAADESRRAGTPGSQTRKSDPEVRPGSQARKQVIHPSDGPVAGMQKGCEDGKRRSSNDETRMTNRKRVHWLTGSLDRGIDGMWPFGNWGCVGNLQGGLEVSAVWLA